MSALEIAEALGAPPPTEEQRAVIEAPLEPALVVAGAGSGKTETMANRVLWLLANGVVAPGEVLGLTFTRKAAGELGARLQDRIRRLAESGLGPEYDAFEPAVVSTYNAFANALFRDNAALLGRDNDGAVLSEASAWQLARSVVLASAHPGLHALDRSVDTITAAVLRLSAALGEHSVDPRDAADFARTYVAAIEELPLGPRGAAYESHFAVLSEPRSLPLVLDLVEEFAQAKLRRGLVEYSDQVSLALRVLERHPPIVAGLRERHRVVLLDEYQDTSVVQTRLLATAFARHPVMAVGDPNQSIYGWRGASAANLERFGADFGDGQRSAVYALSTSWRNGTRILEAANAIAAPLRELSRVPVGTLRAAPSASSVPVAVRVETTVVEEAATVARWFAERLHAGDAGGPPPSAALLLRTRTTLPFFLTALRDVGVPVHVLGVGGLLAEPEIADLVCALTVLHDPAAGSALVRLLAGSRWRLGVADLEALRGLAEWLRERDYAQRRHDDAVLAGMRASFSGDEERSLVDALDWIASAPEGHRELERFSPAGRERLRDAARLFRRLRARGGLDLVDLVGHVLQELRLDVEVLANESRPVGSANLDALFDAIASYAAIADVATLGGFLSWLREAERREDLSPRPEDPEPGTVQILTVHGAKGLEWDLVAVPRLVAAELPARPLEGTSGWLAFGGLPFELRGDREELPSLGWRGAQDRKQLVEELRAFRARVEERHVREERRLAYVAVTRARHELLLTASFWATQSNERPPSPFLRDLERAGVAPALPETSGLEQNPLAELVTTFRWPRDPLGSRRARVEEAAAAVAAAEPALAGPWAADLELLLAERARRMRGPEPLAVPDRIPASRFHDVVDAPERAAAELRRPVPERPYRATRLGTLFHSWVERRAAGEVGPDLLDAVARELDGPGELVDSDAFERLRETFERSEWAGLLPVDVEREIHLLLDGQVVVCRIDAVYEREGRIQIVDWKTGRVPRDEADLAGKRLQLALYRLAYARWRGIDPATIDAVFYYVADDEVVRPERLETEEELVARWRAVVAAPAAGVDAHADRPRADAGR